MILFCDTSALVKLYLAEVGSQAVLACLAEAEAVAVCRIAWVEAHAAFARRVREVPEDADIIDAARNALTADWTQFIILEITQSLLELAANYADVFALRAYDSVQLAAVFETARITETPLTFACFDARLVKAAKTLGIVSLQD